MPTNPRQLLLLVLCVCVPGGTWAASASAQTPAWYDEDWPYRVKITVETAALDAEAVLTDFPVLLDGDVLAVPMARSRSDGTDLVITKADGVTVLAREIVSFQPGAGRAEVWFRAEVLSTAAREFFVYYGNASSAPASVASVWRNDYVAVYHFEEDPGLGVLADWTAAGNDARANQSPSNWTSDDLDEGLIGKGWRFDGTTHFINTNRISTQDGSFTISAWLKHTTRSTDFMFQANPGFWQLASQASDQSHHAQYKDGSVEARFQPSPIPLNEFHHFAWVFDEADGTVRFYFDGVAQGNIFFWPPETDPDDYYVGHAINPDGPAGNELVGILGPMYHNNLDLFNGIGDEFRLNDSMLPVAWIQTEVANQSSPAAFFSVSGEQTPTSTPSESFGNIKSMFRGQNSQ